MKNQRMRLSMHTKQRRPK